MVLLLNVSENTFRVAYPSTRWVLLKCVELCKDEVGRPGPFLPKIVEWIINRDFCDAKLCSYDLWGYVK